MNVQVVDKRVDKNIVYDRRKLYESMDKLKYQDVFC